MPSEPLETPATLTQRIWEDPDALALMFAAGTAELSLNPQLDWFLYTRKVATRPVDRFIETNRSMRSLITLPARQKRAACQALRQLHDRLEQQRGRAIPNDAYLDVLGMTMFYTITVYPWIEGRQMTPEERDSVVAELGEVGHGMGVQGVPRDFDGLSRLRDERFEFFRHSEKTDQLLSGLRRSLGATGYRLLLYTGAVLMEPRMVRELPHGLQAPRWVVSGVLLPACRLGLFRALLSIAMPRAVDRSFG